MELNQVTDNKEYLLPTSQDLYAKFAGSKAHAELEMFDIDAQSWTVLLGN